MAKFKADNKFGTGRPKGSRNRSTVWLDELGCEGVEKVVRAVYDKAVKGDLWAASILLARIWPVRRGRQVILDLPAVDTSAGLVQAHGTVVATMASSEITPEEAVSVGNVFETQRRMIETHDHEERLRELEAKTGTKAGEKSLVELIAEIPARP